MDLSWVEPEPTLWRPPTTAESQGEGQAPVTSLIAYGHGLLDSRSGYPAGIRDPQWQQWVWEHVLGSGTRQRILDAVTERIGDACVSAELDESPEMLARWSAADLAARGRLETLELLPPPSTLREALPSAADLVLRPHVIASLDRWRLVLGRQRRQLPRAAWPTARALDELYGRGRRGTLAGDGPGQGGGRERAYPNVRAWEEELEALFGADVREEILGRAAEHGRTDVLPLLDPDELTPSVELLQQVLSLRGSLGEAQLAQLRPLVARVIEQLVAALSRRIRPALFGLATSRPSRRPSGPPRPAPHHSREPSHCPGARGGRGAAGSRADDLPNPNASLVGLASRPGGGRVGLDGAVGDLQRPDGCNPLGLAGTLGHVPGLQYPGHRHD